MGSPDSVTPVPQDMRGRYEASQDLLGTLRKQLGDSEGERRALEEQLQRLRDKSEGAAQAHEDAQREAQRLRNANDLLSRCLGGQSGEEEDASVAGLKASLKLVTTGHVCLLEFQLLKILKSELSIL